MTKTEYVPQAFEKDGVTEVAHSPRQAVDLKFRGFRHAGSDERREPAYAELQAQAVDLNIPATGKYEDLLEAVTEAQTKENDA